MEGLRYCLVNDLERSSAYDSSMQNDVAVLVGFPDKKSRSSTYSQSSPFCEVSFDENPCLACKTPLQCGTIKFQLRAVVP